MLPIEECVLIKNTGIAALYSGDDVWLIPIKVVLHRATKEKAIESCNWTIDNDRYYIMEHRMNLKKAYVGDDWTICNGQVFGYHDEQCFIAVEPDNMLGFVRRKYEVLSVC